jgi:hypothetical protein
LSRNIGSEDLALDASNGNIYFSNASSTFYTQNYGTYWASFLNINEHDSHGRIVE